MGWSSFTLFFTLLGGICITATAQPTINIHPKSLTADNFTSVTLTVSASAPEPLEYQWHWNGANVPGATASTLQMTNVGLAHLGRYGVTVTSGGTTVESDPADLSLVVPVVPEFDPSLAVKVETNTLQVSWQGAGILQTSSSPAGPWTNVSGIESAYSAHVSRSAQFYRLRNEHPRAVRVFVPSSYREQQPTPLVILFHGYNGSGQEAEEFLHVQPVAETRGFLYAFPDGVKNDGGYRFWNAGDACCDFDDQNVNDSAFVKSLILSAQRAFNVDAKRVHLIGHSNGGFLAHRAARDHSELIASIASIAGVMDREDSRPGPASLVHALQIHGTADEVVPYDGGLLHPAIPRLRRRLPMAGAAETISRWMAWNGCAALQYGESPSLDLVSTLASLDTVVSRALSCGGAQAELWTIKNGSHGPKFTLAFATNVADWLLAHPKP